MVKRIGERGSGTGQTETLGGYSIFYQWACGICGKVYAFRGAAFQCESKHKDVTAQ